MVRDELDHIELWKRWGTFLPPATHVPDMQKTIEAYSTMDPSTLLGAIHAFEVQQPEVAQTKKDGLLRHYDVPAEALTYFDEHLHEEPHIAFGLGLAERHADTVKFAEGVQMGSALVYASLDDFLK